MKNLKSLLNFQGLFVTGTVFLLTFPVRRESLGVFDMEILCRQTLKKVETLKVFFLKVQRCADFRTKRNRTSKHGTNIWKSSKSAVQKNCHSFCYRAYFDFRPKVFNRKLNFLPNCGRLLGY